MDKPLLTATEAAKLIGIDRKTLRLQVREGRAPINPIEGTRPARWLRSEVEAFVAGGSL